MSKNPFRLKKMYPTKSAQSGFTMIELIIVLSIGLIVSTTVAISRQNEAETTQAKNVGTQLSQLGAAGNRYISANYNTLFNNPDCGDADGCVIPVQTLVDGGLLAPNFTSILPRVPQQNDYTFRVRTDPGVAGISNPMVNGLILSNLPWRRTGNASAPRFDLLGIASLNAGPDSGVVTQNVAARPGAPVGSYTINGLNGGWYDSTWAGTNGAADAGRLGIRTGAWANVWNDFLRRDGSLPMLGNLNMNNHSIANANEIQTNRLNARDSVQVGAPSDLGNTSCTNKTSISANGMAITRNNCADPVVALNRNTYLTMLNDAGAGQERIAINPTLAQGAATAANTLTVGNDFIRGNDSKDLTISAAGADRKLTLYGEQGVVTDGNVFLGMDRDLLGKNTAPGTQPAVYLGPNTFLNVNGKNVNIKALLNKYVHKGTYLVVNGANVRKPNCTNGIDGDTKDATLYNSLNENLGTAKIILTPIDGQAPIRGDRVVVPGTGAFDIIYDSNGFYYKATDLDANTWEVNIGAYPYTKTIESVQALANVYCDYGLVSDSGTNNYK